MSKRFNFRTLPGASRGATEANIFIHGYSAGHNSEDRHKLAESIPEGIRHYTNIFAFWPSSHFTRFNGTSRRLFGASTQAHWGAGTATFVGDRVAHFWRIRSRAEDMGEMLPNQLSAYLRLHHPEIDTINLIGHSLGGRLVVSCLKSFASTPGHSLTINDVLLMAAAVKVEPAEAQQMRALLKGRLINAFSKADWTLLMNLDETCLGRNKVEHFENIQIAEFGHGDYWKKLCEVLTYTQFKSPLHSSLRQKDALATAPAPLPAQPLNEQTMTLELNTPGDIYQRINEELTKVLSSLTSQSNDSTLKQAQSEARELLTKHQSELQTQLAELEKNAEWNTFTIAFYGETGAGKSTIIETLRILLREPGKLASQQKFRELQNRYSLSEEGLQQLQQAIERIDARLADLAQQLSATRLHHEQLHSDALEAIDRLQALIAERKQNASLWQKLLNLFRKIPEETELARAEQRLPEVVAKRDNAGTSLVAEQAEAEQNKRDLTQQLQESERRLDELATLADGEIIGDGRSDFTRQTQRYDLQLDGQPFALLDVPGIEGAEELVSDQVKQAVQTAHAVFYVTNSAAPPQTGDDQRKGTLEKIKEHLGAQTEVWTVFNKKVTNITALNRPALTSDDEQAGLAGLNDKMREQLGTHYREVFPLTALPAFLASTDHFAPRSQNARRRDKMIKDFSAEALLEKSRLRAFLQLLNSQLLSGSQAKITRANFNKAGVALNQTTGTLSSIQDTFAELSEKLKLDGQSAQAQLAGSFSALKTRLDATGQRQVDDFASSVRNTLYALIEDDISNDYFEDALKDSISAQQECLSKQLPEAMEKDVAKFQRDAEDILKRFEEQTRELTAIYQKLGNARLDDTFNLKLALDNGLKVTNLLAVLAGGALLWWNPAGWFVLAMGAASIAVGAYKAARSFFSSDYRKAQQRKAVEDNLRSVTGQLRDALQDGLKDALPDMQEKIGQLEQALEAPGKQTTAITQLLAQSIRQLRTLSKQIDNAGKLK